MNVELVAGSSVAGGNDEGLAVDVEADVADEGFVEDLVCGFAIVDGALGLAHEASAGGGGLCLRHGGIVADGFGLRASGVGCNAKVAWLGPLSPLVLFNVNSIA